MAMAPLHGESFDRTHAPITLRRAEGTVLLSRKHALWPPWLMPSGGVWQLSHMSAGSVWPATATFLGFQYEYSK